MENPKMKNPASDDNTENTFTVILNCILEEQHRGITKANAFITDNDFAHYLQMEEAIAASLSKNTNHKQNSDIMNNKVDFDYMQSLQDEIERLAIERQDFELCEILSRENRVDLDRRIHDQKLASEISAIPDDEWEKYGNNFEKPYSYDENEELKFVYSQNFKVYCKGIVSEEMIRERRVVVGGIGVAVCDWKDNLVFEVSKGLEVGGNKHGDEIVIAEITCMIEGLNAALSLDLQKVTIFCDDFMTYQYVTGRDQPNQKRISTLLDQVSLLPKKFTNFQVSLVRNNDVKFAFKLARNAVVSQITWNAEPDKGKKSLKATCAICYEDKDVDQMFSVNGCLHRYCFSCMKHHVEVKLLNGTQANCPRDGCKSEITIEDCGQFLDKKLVDLMSERKKESAIAVTQKVYCPEMRCSALMSKHEVLEYTKGYFVGAEECAARKCMKCGILFCMNCRVPWHYNMTCDVYKKDNPHLHPEDEMLESLAKSKKWRSCTKCNHIVELAEGCYHIYCRCGYEFCYTCGAPWTNKKPTCRCPIWDEANIIRRR